MDSIKELYLKIKASNNINEKNELMEQFNESIDDSFQNRQKYILNHPYLEYIVSSKRGLELFEQFLEKYGLPIESFDRIHKIIETKKNSLDPKRSEFNNPNSQYMFEKYSVILERLNDFKNKWKNAFIMFENTKSNLDYTKIYYDYAISKKPNTNKLLSQYGSGIIPDLIIFNEEYKLKDAILKPIIQNPLFFTESNAQWMFESMKPYSKDSKVYRSVCLNSFDKKLCNLRRREMKNFMESVIKHDFHNKTTFTEEDIKLIDDYIKFKKSIDTSKLDADSRSIIEHQINKAIDLKTQLEDSANIVSDFLQNIVTEGLFSQSTDKRKGTIPDYIKTQFDDYDDEDEEDRKHNPNKSSYDDEDEDDPDNGMNAYKRHTINDDEDHFHSPEQQSTTTSDGKQINYYYYNYTNSFNRHRDDHSHHGSNEYYSQYAPSDKKNPRREIEESILYSIPDGINMYSEHTNIFDLEAYFFQNQI